MKKVCQPVTGILLCFLWLSALCPLWAQQEASYFTVSGVVKDRRTKQSLEFVNVSIPGTPVGTVTNSDGEFSIKILSSLKANELLLSHIGYLHTLLPVQGTDSSGLVVWLTANTNLLDEVIVRAGDPRFLVEEAISKVAVNYSSTGSLLTGFYRETAQKGRRYINLSEAIIDVFKTPYSSRNVFYDKVQVLKGRKLLSQRPADTLIVKLLGGPNLSVLLDIVKNPDVLLDRETLSFYSFKMEESVMLNDNPHYVISFRPAAILPYALYSGRLYIDKERLAFTRAEFSLDMTDRQKATQAVLKKKPIGLKFRPLEVFFLVNYQQRDGISHLSYIRNEVRFRCDWKKRLFSTRYTILSEMVITDGKAATSGISNRLAFKANQSLSDKVADFADNAFWGAYNIIEPTESLETAVSKLRKQ